MTTVQVAQPPASIVRKFLALEVFDLEQNDSDVSEEIGKQMCVFQSHTQLHDIHVHVLCSKLSCEC